jgi:hypothetical protein
MRFAAWKQIAVPALMVFSWLPASSQALPPQAPTSKVDTQLALVDVVAEIKEKIPPYASASDRT